MLGDSINTFAMMGSDLGNITTRNVDYLTSNFKLNPLSNYDANISIEDDSKKKHIRHSYTNVDEYSL